MVQTLHFSLSDLDGSGIQVAPNNTEKIDAIVDLRKFYKDLFTALMENGFQDGSEIKKHLLNENIEQFGILVNAGDDSLIDGFKGTRHNGMFEKKYRLIQHSNGKTYDYETTWHARVKSPVLGWWYEFEMDIACRNYENIEMDIGGGQKKVMQKGKWEFRNKAFLRPSSSDFQALKGKMSILEPFVSSKRMEKIFLNHIMFKKITYDVNWAENNGNSVPFGVINNHFKN